MDGLAFIRNLHGPDTQPRPHVMLMANSVKSRWAAKRADVDDVVTRSVPRAKFVTLLRSALLMRQAERAVWARSNLVSGTGESSPEAGPVPPDELPGDRTPGAGSAGKSPARRRALIAALVIALLVLGAGILSRVRAPGIAPVASITPSPLPKLATSAPVASTAGARHATGAGSRGAGGPVVLAAGTIADGDVAAAAAPPAPPPVATGAAPVEPLPGTGVLVLDGAGRPMLAEAPDVPRTPASTVKVLTAAAALATLGPDARFTTRLVAAGRIRAGVLAGSLALVGGGDPVLRAADLDAAATAIAAAGIRRIRGGLVIDATAFAAPEFNPHWSLADRALPYAAGTSAVSLDEGTRLVDDRGTWLREAVPDQSAYAGAQLREALRAQHVTIDGPTRVGVARPGTVLWQHQSPPVSALVGMMLANSDNHIAEHLLRQTGLVASGVGSEAAGIAALVAYANALDVPTTGLQLYDGAGLAADDLATPRTLATLLWRLRGTAEGAQLRAALTPIGGTSDRISAKTGTVGLARDLAGYVDRSSGAPLSFALLGDVRQAGDLPTLRANEIRVLDDLAR
jgi:D-alanyl-D-alanine carboxypeptidase/D-alanyl-D-alanine-endopeptidase (penicillin-binding protein 4)